MYKITMKCTKGDEYEVNPVGESLNFVRVAYTNDAEVANYYNGKIGLISIEEVADEEAKNTL